MIKLFLSLFIFSGLAFCECSITIYPHILKLQKNINSSIIKKSDCPDKVQGDLLQFINKFESKIKTAHLKAAIQSELDEDITITPKEINIVSLADYVTNELSKTQMIITDISTLSSSPSINSNSPIIGNIICTDCNKTGHKNLKLQLQEKSIWISANFNEKVFAFVSKKSLSPTNKNLSISDFTKKEVIYDGQGQLFTDFKNIQFYKLTRAIKTQQPLSITDVTPKIVVQANKLVDVILKNDSIILKSKAIARQSARIGQSIELYNTKTKKRINATAVDYNKVMVNL
jgi:flagella basal body P-ring formation protein FlgA